MTNPLKQGARDDYRPRAFNGVEEMRDWCAARNASAAQHGWTRWLYVADQKNGDGSPFHVITELTGLKAREVLDYIGGRPPAYVGWSEHDTRNLTAAVRTQARMGMTDAEFEAWDSRRKKAAA